MTPATILIWCQETASFAPWLAVWNARLWQSALYVTVQTTSPCLQANVRVQPTIISRGQSASRVHSSCGSAVPVRPLLSALHAQAPMSSFLVPVVSAQLALLIPVAVASLVRPLAVSPAPQLLFVLYATPQDSLH